QCKRAAHSQRYAANDCEVGMRWVTGFVILGLATFSLEIFSAEVMSAQQIPNATADASRCSALTRLTLDIAEAPTRIGSARLVEPTAATEAGRNGRETAA